MKARFLAGLVLLVMALTSCDETTETIGSSLTDNMDFLKITTDSFKVTSRSIIADSVLSRNAMGCARQYHEQNQRRSGGRLLYCQPLL